MFDKLKCSNDIKGLIAERKWRYRRLLETQVLLHCKTLLVAFNSIRIVIDSRDLRRRISHQRSSIRQSATDIQNFHALNNWNGKFISILASLVSHIICLVVM